MKQRGKAVVLVGLIGCVAVGVADQTDVDVQAIGDSQGTNMQGTNMQGTNMQGTTYDGADWQYTSLTNATWGGQRVTVTLDHATLSFVRLNKFVTEEHFPDKICTSSAFNTRTCTTVNLATTASPIAGLSFDATFYSHELAMSWTSKIQIGTGTTDKTAVAKDMQSAMFPISGSNASTCGMDYRSSCQNPNGCRLNCDIWLYSINLIDSSVNAGSPSAMCTGGGAIAVPGVYAHDGTRSDGDGTQFTFSCQTGTIAKCTRWGFRPWGTAAKNCVTNCSTPPPAVPLVDLHQSCIRAAMADYCARGLSQTRPGTLIDIWDFDPSQSNTWGFIPKTRGGLVGSNQATALVFESQFDKTSAYRIDHDRYDEVVGTAEGAGTLDLTCIAALCPQNDHCSYQRAYGGLDQASAITIDSTTACAHSERLVGKWESRNCSQCTALIASYADTHPDYQHCITDSAEGWDEDCVLLAGVFCGAGIVSTPVHHECATGSALGKLATGCTARVCLDRPSCCTSSWTATCVDDANAKCYGGRESSGMVPLGFCGTSVMVEAPTHL
jgi:uncharacterized protein YjbI with pentapeptide repeats